MGSDNGGTWFRLDGWFFYIIEEYGKVRMNSTDNDHKIFMLYNTIVLPVMSINFSLGYCKDACLNFWVIVRYLTF